MTFDPQWADQVMQTALANSNTSPEELKKHVNSLGPDEQEQFVRDTAKIFGIAEPQAQPAVGKGEFNMTPTEGAVLGASQALPAGKVLAPVSGAIEKGIAKVLPESMGGLSPENYQEMYGNKTPSELGAETSAMLGSAQKEFPLQYALGQGAGAAALTAPFGAVGATVPFMAGQGAVTGALETEGGLPERAMGALKGAVVGAVAGKAAKSLGELVLGGSKAVGSAAQALEDMSTSAARRAVGYTKGAILKAGGVERVDDMVRTLQREGGLFTKGLGLDKVAERVGELGENAANRINQLYSGPLGSLESVSAQDLKTAIANRVRAGLEKFREINPSKLTQMDQVDELLTRVSAGKPTLTNADLWELQKGIGEKAWEKGVMNENLGVFQDTWKVVKDALNRGMKGAPELQQANKVYSAAKEMGKVLEGKLGQQAGASNFGLMKLGATAIGAGIGGLPGAATGAVIEHVAEKYGNQGLSVAAKKASEVAATPIIDKVLKIAPKLGAAGKFLTDSVSRGPAAVAAAHYVLQKSDPKYQQKVQDLMDEEVNRGPE